LQDNLTEFINVVHRSNEKLTTIARTTPRLSNNYQTELSHSKERLNSFKTNDFNSKPSNSNYKTPTAHNRKIGFSSEVQFKNGKTKNEKTVNCQDSSKVRVRELIENKFIDETISDTRLQLKKIEQQIESLKASTSTAIHSTLTHPKRPSVTKQTNRPKSNARTIGGSISNSKLASHRDLNQTPRAVNSNYYSNKIGHTTRDTEEVLKPIHENQIRNQTRTPNSGRQSPHFSTLKRTTSSKQNLKPRNAND
jgi:hypothetical protein